MRDDGVRYARDHLGRLPLVLTVRLARVWNLDDPLQLPEGRSGARGEARGAHFFVLVPLAVAGALVLRRRRVAVWILLTPFIVVSFTALTTYGNQRFREPADLALVVLAAVAIDALLRGRRTSRARAAAA